MGHATTATDDVQPAGDAARDAVLVRAARRGDLDAFETLVTRHEKRIYGLARRLTGSEHDAQDVTQQTFLSAMQNLGAFRGRAAFSTWLATIATHAAFKVLRTRRRRRSVSLDEHADADSEGPIPHPEYIADWRETPDRMVQQAETRRLLDAAIGELDAGHRAVFLLRDVEALSVRETARALGISEANVKVRLLRARMRLRERLTRAFGDASRRFSPSDHAHGFAARHAVQEDSL